MLNDSNLIAAFTVFTLILMAMATSATPSGANSYGQQSALPKKFGFVLFPTFQTLDIAGPLDIFQFLSTKVPDLELYLVANTLDPVSTKFTETKIPGISTSNFGWSIVPTHTFDNAPDIDVLFVPGGFGTRPTGDEGERVLGPVRKFIKERFPKVKYLLTVCTGSGLAAQTGVLDGYKATSNKASWAWATAQGPRVKWVPVARWTVDGENDKIWTSSGVSAGMDMALAWVAHVYNNTTEPADLATDIANREEYERHLNPNWDPFAAVYNVSGAGDE